ncbi:MAG: NADH-quinone oxidoreductase subunit N, partial [Phycisphaerae bacterium]|nr:NADH-quinone oxidoreductase subunit N [Phycisphaerae bacterium]
MQSLTPKFTLITPEILLFAGSVVVAVLGLSPMRMARRSVPWVAVAALLATLFTTLSIWTPEAALAAGLPMPMLGKYVIVMLCVLGIGHVLIASGSMDRHSESMIAQGRAAFDPVRMIQGEFFAFMLLSLCGAMLLTHATDLIWLFLAFELCSLPTYIMVAIGRNNNRSMEAAVKYFFLGALSTAIMLFGFAMLYGATGTVELAGMREAFTQQAANGGVGMTALVGMLLAIVGICFKLAAVPMQFYAPDVYEGAATPVTAFISFVPKVQGFIMLVLLLGTIGWNDGTGLSSLPPVITAVLWMVAVLTMTLGNIGGLLQKSAKRMLAYSSIANSGYMLVGVLAGPSLGLDSMLLYLLTYGVANLATFGALSSVERNGAEVDAMSDLDGLRQRAPLAAIALALGALSLTGIPPILGFWGKLYIFMTGVQAHTVATHQVALLVILAVNSAIAAFYYLRLIAVPFVNPTTPRSQGVSYVASVWPRITAVTFGLATLALPAVVGTLKTEAESASKLEYQVRPGGDA